MAPTMLPGVRLTPRSAPDAHGASTRRSDPNVEGPSVLPRHWRWAPALTGARLRQALGEAPLDDLVNLTTRWVRQRHAQALRDHRQALARHRAHRAHRPSPDSTSSNDVLPFDLLTAVIRHAGWSQAPRDPRWTTVINALVAGGAARPQDPLIEAIDAGNRAMTDLLIANGALARVNGADPLGRTALHMAVVRSEPDLVQTLLDAGADVHARTITGQTPLLFLAVLDPGRHRPAPGAAQALQRAQNQDRVVALLAQAGADLDATDQGGQSALHLAVRDDNRPLITTLIRHGATVDGPDQHGATPKDQLHRRIEEIDQNWVHPLIRQRLPNLRHWREQAVTTLNHLHVAVQAHEAQVLVDAFERAGRPGDPDGSPPVPTPMVRRRL